MGLESRKRSFEGDSSSSGQRSGKYMRGNEPLLKTLVPNVIAGMIIGKAGKNLAEMKTKYGGHVRVSGNVEYYPGTEERVVIISGTVPEIIENYKHILEISHDTGREPLKDGRGDKNLMVVTNSCAGMLIGKGGAAVKAIQDEFQVKMSIADNVLGDVAVSSERVLSMSGRIDKRIDACSQIIETIAEEAENMANTNIKYPPNITVGGNMLRSDRDHEHRRSSGLGSQSSFDGRPSRYDDRASRYDDRASRYDDRASRYDDRASRYDDRASRYDDRPSRNESRVSRYDDMLAIDRRNVNNQYSDYSNQRERKKNLPLVFKSEIEARLEIPDKVVGHLLGKGGQTIKSFAQQSRGARFKFSEKDEFVKDTTNRTLTISGTLEQVRVAFELVQAKGEDFHEEGFL